MWWVFEQEQLAEIRRFQRLARNYAYDAQHFLENEVLGSACFCQKKAAAYAKAALDLLLLKL